jgi:hypothetical protein
MLSSQSMSNVVSSVAKRLAFTGKHKVQCSHKPDQMKKSKTQLRATGAATKVSVIKSSTKTRQNDTANKTKLQKKQKPTKKVHRSYLNKSLW